MNQITLTVSSVLRRLQRERKALNCPGKMQVVDCTCSTMADLSTLGYNASGSFALVATACSHGWTRTHSVFVHAAETFDTSLLLLPSIAAAMSHAVITGRTSSTRRSRRESSRKLAMQQCPPQASVIDRLRCTKNSPERVSGCLVPCCPTSCSGKMVEHNDSTVRPTT